jgi:hypothetical protein
VGVKPPLTRDAQAGQANLTPRERTRVGKGAELL